MRILALMPHPDDIEFLCAGTLLRLLDAGCEIHTATMTPGDKGSVELEPAEIAEVRRNEAKEASAMLGAASHTCLEFCDLEIVFDNQSRRRVAGFIRQVDPNLIFTTAPADYMFDHEITSQLVRDACFNAGVRNYPAEPANEPIGKVPYLYYADPIGGHDIFGTAALVGYLVNVTAKIHSKAELLACHDSQRSWLRKQHGMDDYIESMLRWCAARGARLGVPYAEAFRQHLGHPHPTDNLLADLLANSKG